MLFFQELSLFMIIRLQKKPSVKIVDQPKTNIPDATDKISLSTCQTQASYNMIELASSIGSLCKGVKLIGY